jgi:hypothetical protein
VGLIWQSLSCLQPSVHWKRSLQKLPAGQVSGIRVHSTHFLAGEQRGRAASGQSMSTLQVQVSPHVETTGPPASTGSAPGGTHTFRAWSQT